jgi:hypothetical protein
MLGGFVLQGAKSRQILFESIDPSLLGAARPYGVPGATGIGRVEVYIMA